MTTQPQLRVVGTGDAPPPLLPPDIDLSDLPEVMLNIQWICDSRFSITASADEQIAAIRLHARSIHEKPAATLPNEDVELAFLAGYGRDLQGWRQVKERALEGWSLYSDGRLYRRDMAVKALDAWIKRLVQRRKSAAGVAKRKRVAFNPEAYDRPIATAVDALYALEPHAPVLRNHMNVDPEIEPEALTSGSTPGQTPGSTKGREAKQSESSGYISPTAQAVGAGQPGEDSGTGAPQPEVEKARKRVRPWPVDAFERVWEGYDYKRDRLAAQEAFQKLVEDPPVEFDDLMLAVMRYRQFKPPSNDTAYLATWLNRRRWLDVYADPPPTQPRGRGGGSPMPFSGRKPFQPTSYRGRG